MPKPQKDDDLRNMIGGSVRSTIQKVQRIHQLECSYASFMILFRYYLFLLYTYCASTKKQCYVVLCLLVYFLLPQRRRTIQAIGWEVRFGQKFRRYREFIRLNVRMLPLWYRYVIIYAYSTKITLLKRSIQKFKLINYLDLLK